MLFRSQGRITERLTRGDPAEAKVPGDRRWLARAGSSGIGGEADRIGEIAVVAEAHVGHAVARRTAIEIYVDRAFRCADRPEQSIATDAGVVVGNLVGVRVERVNLTPIDVESDERESAVARMAVLAAEDTLHEPHVGVEVERLSGARVHPGAVYHRGAHRAFEVRDR